MFCGLCVCVICMYVYVRNVCTYSIHEAEGGVVVIYGIGLPWMVRALFADCAWDLYICGCVCT